MSASQSPGNITSEENDPLTIVYDPTDPFWQDDEDDDDDMDMDYHPALDEDGEDEEGDDELNFHGTSHQD